MKRNVFNVVKECWGTTQHRVMGAFLTLSLIFFSSGLSGQSCSDITFNFAQFEACKFRLTYQNSSECYTQIRLALAQGTFSSYSVNTPAGFAIQEISPSELWITHNNGFLPLGFQGPLIFTLPVGLVTTVSVAYLNDCPPGIGCELFPGPTLESCADPMDASISGVVYSECGSKPYSNQQVVSGWTVQLLDIDGNLISEQQTDADGFYRFFDLPLGLYIVKEITAPGWSPSVPASGQTTVDVAPSAQIVQNFGVCNFDCCKSIQTDVKQIYASNDTCCYQLSYTSTAPSCIQSFTVTVGAGQFISNWTINLPGWTVVPGGPQTINIFPPPGTGGFITPGTVAPVTFCVFGTLFHNVLVRAVYNDSAGAHYCDASYSFICSGSADACSCPNGGIPGVNLVVNSDFSMGGGFTSSYVNGGAVLTEGQYWIGSNPNQVNPGFQPCHDHTTGSGNFLVVNGSTSPNQNVWCETITVVPNTIYNFGAWVTSLTNASPAQFQLTINNVNIGNVFTAPLACDWDQLCASWYSGPSTSAIICLKNLNTSSAGNDFGLDDITFNECKAPPACTCNPMGTVTVASGASVFTLNCSNHGFLPILPCPPDDVHISTNFGCVSTTGANCGSSISWHLEHPLGTVVASGSFNTNQSLSIPAAVVTPVGGYYFFMETICPGTNDTCRCQTAWVRESCDSCCQDYDAFCQKVENAVSFVVDNANCKVTMNVGNLPPCDSIVWVNWGDGSNNQNGPFWAGTMPMHMYNGSGQYVISYLALEYDQFGHPCFDKVLSDTITLQCDTACSCGPDPFQMEIRYGGALNQPVHCGDVITLSQGFFVLYTAFTCQGGVGCNPARVEWRLQGPNLLTGGAVNTNPPGFVIPPLSPANFTDPGTYTLTMDGFCGSDTCHCTVTFCLPPPPPVVNDTMICRTHTSAYIPLYGCPSTCGVTQVRWFIKQCSAANWPTTPYQVSSGPNCDPLLFLPYKYPNETCVQVYAEITLDGSCCNTTQLISNIATITLCDPISCSITNPNAAGFCQCGIPQQLTVTPAGVNCPYTVQWYYQGQPITGATGLTYQPPQLCFQPNAASNCYYDHVFTAEFKGICGTSSCSTSIRVYDPNAPVGVLDMVPFEAQPFCPGEDATLCYTPECAGDPQKWDWSYSTTSATAGFSTKPEWGDMDKKINTNKLFQTTWYKVEKQNGVCPKDEVVYKIEVKDAITITDFKAIPDACLENHVDLSIDFTPSPVTGAGCFYIVEWYKDGNLIHTTNTGQAPVTYTYPGPNIPGVYYAVVRDNCCPQSATTWAISIAQPCVPVILGPCFRCNNDPVTLMGEMVLPPQDPCPGSVFCTFQWYYLDLATNTWLAITGGTGSTVTVNFAGHFKLVTTCDYGFGPCTKEAVHDVAQCSSTGSGCQFVDAPEVVVSTILNVDIQPNPTNGDITLHIGPAPLREGRVEVVGLDGRVLLSENIPDQQASHTMSLNRLTTGLYFVRVYAGKVLIWTDKIVKAE